MHQFSRLHKMFWRLLFTNIGLLFLMISFFTLLTAFSAAVLVMDYDWSMLMAAIVCLSPWLAVIVILFIVLLVKRTEYDEEKAELFNSSRNVIISKLIMYVIEFILARRKKAKTEKEC
ncbi:MAG: hypothetical protein EXR81_00545 [Gammaproteobacteria bacterium]|nr:hypothetical protein [Gammaproteobacteria bacterium]